MGSKFVQVTFDDIDESEGAAECFKFDVLGASYEIDLNPRNTTKATRALEAARKLIFAADAAYDEAVKAAEEARAAASASVENTLEWLLSKARKPIAAKKPAKRVNKTVPGEDRSDWPKVRVWANENGYTVAPIGIIARHIVEAYYSRNRSRPAASAKAVTKARLVTNPFTPTPAQAATPAQPELTLTVPAKPKTGLSRDLTTAERAGLYKATLRFAGEAGINPAGLTPRKLTAEMVQATEARDDVALRELLGG